VGEVVRDNTFEVAKDICPVLKVPRQCPHKIGINFYDAGRAALW
jgi:hypothetical protein